MNDIDIFSSFGRKNDSSQTECRKFRRTDKERLRSTIRSSFRIHDANFLTGGVRNPRRNSQLIREPPYFRNPQIRSISRLTPRSVRFLRPSPSIREPIHPPQLMKQVLVSSCYAARRQKLRSHASTSQNFETHTDDLPMHPGNNLLCACIRCLAYGAVSRKK